MNTQSQDIKKPDPPFFPAQLPWHRKLYKWHRALLVKLSWALLWIVPIGVVVALVLGYRYH